MAINTNIYNRQLASVYKGICATRGEILRIFVLHPLAVESTAPLTAKNFPL